MSLAVFNFKYSLFLTFFQQFFFPVTNDIVPRIKNGKILCLFMWRKAER